MVSEGDKAGGQAGGTRMRRVLEATVKTQGSNLKAVGSHRRRIRKGIDSVVCLMTVLPLSCAGHRVRADTDYRLHPLLPPWWLGQGPSSHRNRDSLLPIN